MLARAATLLARRAQQQQLGFTVGRAFAAAPAATEPDLPEPPVKFTGGVGSIATLAWQCAVKSNALEQVQSELQQVLEVFHTNEQFRTFALDPFVPVASKVKLVKSLLGDSSATEITKRLFEALAEENALSAVQVLSHNFDELVLAHKKEVFCTLVTSKPLDVLERKELTSQAAKFVDPGFKLITKEKVDKKILGGFILEFEDRLVDLSVAKKLEEFNNLVFKLEADLKG